MTPERWQQIETLYHAARERSVDRRAAFLAEACRGDTQLQREVETLLAQPSEAGMLDRPVAPGEGETTGGAELAGRRLGTYQLQRLIGAGGMGDVYLARDTRLGRDVAIKILPRAFTSSRERLERFEREARVLASLNHPNIGAIYGLEEVDASSGSERAVMKALVLEFVEGETLAERIGRGPLPFVDALPIARQIADALDAAHERGIVHRDLKPANIAIRADGTVKVVDFGIAKAMTGEEASGLDLSALPTLGTVGTREGLVIGTPTYMSPEQARGQAVDKRTDIWAFGCVLYEMLVGRAAFPGETISDTIAALLEREPDWNALPATIPPAIRRLLRRCLEKGRKRRLSDIADARLEIDEALTRPEDKTVASSARGRNARRAAWLVGAAVALVAFAALALRTITPSGQTPAEPLSMRFSVFPPDGWRVNTVLMPSAGSTAPLALSPDGKSVAFLARNADGRSQLWIRALDTLDSLALEGTDGAQSPFWSPDSRWLGFFADGRLKKIDVAGRGLSITICAAVDNRGGAWSRNGVIVFAPDHDGPLQKVSAAGGAPTAATALAPGESGHERPSFLPDGRHFLYSSVAEQINALYVASLDSSDREQVLEDSDSTNVVYAQGHLVYLRSTALVAQPFDADDRRLTGEPVPIAQGIRTQGTFGVAGDFAVSATGVLVYQTGSREGPHLEWVDRTGKALGTLGEPGNYAHLELSPDGTRAAVSIADPAHNNTRDIWLYDVARGLRTRLTSDPGNDIFPIWSPDGNRVAFTSDRRGSQDVYQKAAAGAGRDEPIVEGDLNELATSWSPDGQYLLYQLPAASGAPTDVWAWPMVDRASPVPFLQTSFGDRRARFSPDGRWVAYESDESGKDDVWVRPFPRAGAKWLISTKGGTWPRWRRDGKEIFYLAPDSRLMAAEVNGRGTAFQVGDVRPLFQTHAATPLGAPYDAIANGQRFLVNVIGEDTTPTPITVVINWAADLKR